jgi:hypothetical protein
LELLCEFYQFAALTINFFLHLLCDYWVKIRARRHHEHVKTVLKQAQVEAELDLEHVIIGTSFPRVQSLTQFVSLAEDG